jgi:hypothetical protein
MVPSPPAATTKSKPASPALLASSLAENGVGVVANALAS